MLPGMPVGMMGSTLKASGSFEAGDEDFTLTNAARSNVVARTGSWSVLNNSGSTGGMSRTFESGPGERTFKIWVRCRTGTGGFFDLSIVDSDGFTTAPSPTVTDTDWQEFSVTRFVSGPFEIIMSFYPGSVQLIIDDWSVE